MAVTGFTSAIKNVAERVAKWRDTVPEIVVVVLLWLGKLIG